MSPSSSTRHLRPLVLLTALLVAGCTADDPGPDAAPTSGSPTSAAATTPAVTPTDPPADEAPAPATLVLRAHGFIGDFPADSPEGDVVAYLTETLGTEPAVLEDTYACEQAGQAGRLLEWGALRVFVLTSELDGTPSDPYVAGWFLVDSDDAATADLATAEGLRVGDSRDRLLELYPGASGAPWVDPSITWWDTSPDGTYVVFTGEDGTVSQINSGYACVAD